MQFISYAQNLEDVILWRALGHIPEGFYIDIGANDPVEDSVTKAFYDRGWSGVNIEPLPSHYADLSRERVRDINLNCAAGAAEGELDIWECDIRGWASASDEAISHHKANGHRGNFLRVPMSTLSKICRTHVKGEIHFMKIDVEGLEATVLEGMDFSHFRPWVLVIESTKPDTTEECHHLWEKLVLDSSYVFCFADGLNRFYVASEQSFLLDSFRYPPNIFDNFIHFNHVQALSKAADAQAKAADAEAKAADAEAKAADAEAKAADAEAKAADAASREAELVRRVNMAESQLALIYASRRWRLLLRIQRLSASIKQLILTLRKA